MLIRAILPNWAYDQNPSLRRVREGEYSFDEIVELNEQFYNIYFLPNGPSLYDSSRTVDGADIDQFHYVFADFDLKDGTYPTKEAFLEEISEAEGLTPTSINDSGNGIHVYWRVTDLDAMSYLKLQRRLIRRFKTDEAVGQIYQLMRVPGTVNTKHDKAFKMCEEIFTSDSVYTAEDLDKRLPPITLEDEEYCKQHFDKTYSKEDYSTKVNVKIPLKFEALMRASQEVRDIWLGNVDDRSKGDFRLGHLMFASGFTKDEAMSVLVNTAKALQRAPKHQISYAENIVNQIWTYELTKDKTLVRLSKSVREILAEPEADEGTRFRCYRWLDDTNTGFRLGHVVGVVAGSGVGKTTLCLNMFKGFVEYNPEYLHVFIPLEQPAKEIAARWDTVCKGKDFLHDKVHVVSNRDENGNFRQLSLDEIRIYLKALMAETGQKLGAVVIDHIGALKKKGRNGENQDIMDICHQMKGVALELNCFMVMQSQAPREKAGIGDLELNKDAAYGTVYFESYCDFLITLWQPLKRCYKESECPSTMAYKFCKIRHKKRGVDKLEEDVPYSVLFDPETETIKEMKESDRSSFTFYLTKATNKRKLDRKTDLVEYTSVKVKGFNDGQGKVSTSQN